MKNLYAYFLFTLLLTICSCQKPIVFVEGSGPGGTEPKTAVNSMSAKVNGVLVTCEMAVAQTYTSDGKINIQLNGFKNPQAFVISWQDFKGVRTYNAADVISNASYISGISDPFTQSYFAESGTVKVTTYTDKIISGTFEFKGVNAVGETKTITEGKFTVSLEPPTAPSPPSSSENVSAKVDGTLVNFSGEGTLLNIPALGKTMTIIGINGQKIVTLVIYNYNGNGTYNIDNIAAQGGYNSSSAQSESYGTPDGKNSGKIVVASSTATSIRGTFEFVATNDDTRLQTKKTITEGQFNVAVKAVSF